MIPVIYRIPETIDGMMILLIEKKFPIIIKMKATALLMLCVDLSFATAAIYVEMETR